MEFAGFPNELSLPRQRRQGWHGMAGLMAKRQKGREEQGRAGDDVEAEGERGRWTFEALL